MATDFNFLQNYTLLIRFSIKSIRKQFGFIKLKRNSFTVVKKNAYHLKLSHSICTRDGLCIPLKRISLDIAKNSEVKKVKK